MRYRYRYSYHGPKLRYQGSWGRPRQGRVAYRAKPVSSAKTAHLRICHR
jgi:hypothetical protein